MLVVEGREGGFIKVLEIVEEHRRCGRGCDGDDAA